MGSKKRFPVVAALVAAAAAACVNGDATQGQVVEALTNADATEAQAQCTGTRLENGLSQDEFNTVADAAELDDLAGEPIADSDQDLREFTTSVLEECMEDPESADTTDGGAEEDGGDTGVTESSEE